MMRVFVDGVGLLGPGLAGWTESQDVLRGEQPVMLTPVSPPLIEALPPAERRRTGAVVKLAVAAGLEAIAQAGADASDMATVFSSSGADGDTIHAILTVLTSDQREISPTRFHNSVHNAPSGYWALACAATAPSTSLCGFDGSFATGLLDAAAQVCVDQRAVTLISYDLPYPKPLLLARPMEHAFAVSLVLSPVRSAASIAELRIAPRHGAGRAASLADPGLEELRTDNPAGRSLGLLVALASGGGDIGIEGNAGTILDIAVTRL